MPKMKTKKNIYKNLLTLSILAVLFFSSIPGFVQAALVPCGRSEDDPFTSIDESQACQLCHVFVLFDNIVDFILFEVVPLLAVLMVVIAGVILMTASDNPANVNKAKDVLKAVVIGLVLIYGAWLLINLFFLVIGLADWKMNEGWFNYPCP
ncbi:MAG TPA: pilin [Patescibacteria group bacterium]|nr:pilin [Patescibacteria group bacterium]